jgi:hypothetical protein
MYDLLAVESYSKARKDLPNVVQYTDFAESDSESQQSKAVSRKSVRRSSRWKRKYRQMKVEMTVVMKHCCQIDPHLLVLWVSILVTHT